MSHWVTDTAFLAVANFIAGIIGFFYRLFLSRELGPQGMGIYQQTLAFYFTSITIITAGIPLSVSKLVAENRKNLKTLGKTVSSAYTLTMFFLMMGCIYLVIISIVMERLSILLVLPAALLVGISAILRGYFLGVQNTPPISYSLLAESIVRAFLGAFFVKDYLLIRLELQTRGAITALSIGELVSLLILFFFFHRSNLLKGEALKFGNTSEIKKILQIAIPVSLSQIIGSVSGSAEALLIPKSLIIAGFTPSEALAIYGKTSGMVMPLLFFPAILIGSLSSNLIPQISRALSQKDTSYAFKLSEQALIFTTFFSFCVAGFFISLATPIGEILFKGYGLEKLIMGFGSGIPFFYMENILRALLRATGNNHVPLMNSFLSLITTNGILFLLVTNPSFGILGYAIALITSSALCIFISMGALEKTLKKRLNVRDIFIKPLLCCVFMVFILSRSFQPLVNMDIPKILCVGGTLLLGMSGYLALAMTLGIDIRNTKNR